MSARNPPKLVDEANALLDNNPNAIEESFKRLNKEQYVMLRNRIEEQARLIVFYKNRGDEFSRKNMNLEKLNHDLVEQKAFKFLKIDTKHAAKEAEIIDDSVKKITEIENEMMKGRLDEQSNLIVFYKNRSEESQEKYLSLEKLIQDQQKDKERLGKEYDESRKEFFKKKNELEAKIVGLVEICNENDREMLDLKAEYEARLQGSNGDKDNAISGLKEEYQRIIENLNLETINRIEALQRDSRKEISGLFVFSWLCLPRTSML